MRDSSVLIDCWDSSFFSFYPTALSFVVLRNLAVHMICIITLCASEAAAQCIVIDPACLFVCGWVCHHDNSKLRSSILTKLGL